MATNQNGNGNNVNTLHMTELTLTSWYFLCC